ncbi:MAG TPA: carbohydrate binding domain-containing protein [Myxococcota bacterium]|nr:carbohydrate binding domain-containing protein [Myxococcota bacterium]
MNSLRLLPLLFVLFMVGCPEDEKRPIGSTCGSDEQCVSGLCASNVCVDPAGDEDGDGLINGLEAALGSNAFDADSDADGKPDIDELGGDPARDGDGDGRPDLIESAIADLDGDCVVDETDPDADGPGELLEACLSEGVCTTGVELRCDLQAGQPTGCEYGKVVGYMEIDACDGLDNDCDGTTDENCGLEPITSCDDVLRANAVVENRPYPIDPDGPGPEPELEVACAMGMAGRGWGRLTPAYEAALGRSSSGLRQYLFLADDGRFVVSPWTDGAFPWGEVGHLAGAWLTGIGDDLGSLGSFGCDTNAAESGVGFGCFASSGLSASRVLDRDTAELELCGRGVDAWQGCATATVHVREAPCATSKLNLIGDSEFDALIAGEPTCWRIESFEGGLDELSANVSGDFEDAPSEQAPSLRAEPYVPTPGMPWFVSLVQEDLVLVAGVQYRLTFWAKASAFRVVMVELGGDFVELLPVGDSWRLLEVDFVPETTTTLGSVRFYLSDLDDTEETLWLDGVLLLEGRYDACKKTGPELIANGGFDAGLACWERLRSLEDATQSLATSFFDAPVTAPSAHAEPAPNDDSEGGAPYLSQTGLALAAGRSYTLSFSARASEARTLRVTLVDESESGLYLDQNVELGTAWATSRLDFEVPSTTTTSTARLIVFFGHPTIAPVWIDDLSLSETPR